MGWKVIAAMRRLRMIICVCRDCVFEDQVGEIICLPGNTRWFRWSGCPYQKLTFQNSRNEQLCLLDLSDGRFRDLESHGMVFPQLKVLDLSFCRSLIRTPDFTHLPCLVKLVLDACSSLVEIDESIGHAKKLAMLSLQRCSKLERLPTELGMLTSLEFLNLSGCLQLSYLPNSIGGLQSLEVLNLEGCMKILVLPKQMGELKSLKNLNLGSTGISDILDTIDGGERICVLPEDLGNLRSLNYLGLSRTLISNLPDFIGRLHSLERLDITECFRLRRLPDAMGGLRSLSWLSLKRCKVLEQLPDSMGVLTSLKELDIRNCESLTEVPESLGGLNKDLQISLEGCISLEKIPNSIIRTLVSGKDHDKLQLNGLKSLKRLPGSLGDVEGVRTLSLRDCKSLEEIPDSIGRLKPLKDIDLSACTLLRKMPESIGNMKSLKRLNLRHCRSLEEQLPESMEGLESLEVLYITSGKSLKKVPDFVGKLKNIQELHLREFEEVPVHLISGLPRLNKFCIKDCPNFESLPELPSSLTILKVLRCAAAFGESPDLSNLNDMEKLHLGGCKTLADLSGIERFKSLKQLILTARDGLGRELVDKLSQPTFERLGELFVSGARDGSDLLFGLPKAGQVDRLVGMFCLADEPPANRSHINVRIQVQAEGKTVTEGTWRAERTTDDVEFMQKLGMHGKGFYEIGFGKDEEISRYVLEEGHAVLRVPTIYNDYQLKMGYYTCVRVVCI